jgi:hypothetical protein
MYRNLFVTFAEQNAARHDDVAGFGNGFVDEFSPGGQLIARIASGGVLDSPWGLDIAPSGFGQFAGDLLVGNFGDGTINAFDLKTDQYVGTLLGSNGQPVQIGDLGWSGSHRSCGRTAVRLGHLGPELRRDLIGEECGLPVRCRISRRRDVVGGSGHRLIAPHIPAWASSASEHLQLGRVDHLGELGRLHAVLPRPALRTRSSSPEVPRWSCDSAAVGSCC